MARLGYRSSYLQLKPQRPEWHHDEYNYVHDVVHACAPIAQWSCHAPSLAWGRKLSRIDRKFCGENFRGMLTGRIMGVACLKFLLASEYGLYPMCTHASTHACAHTPHAHMQYLKLAINLTNEGKCLYTMSCIWERERAHHTITHTPDLPAL